jgi:hypothetical protein
LQYKQPAGGKGVRGEFRPAEYVSRNKLRPEKLPLILEFMSFVFQKKSEQNSTNSILVHIHLKVQEYLRNSAIFQLPKTLFYQLKSAILVCNSYALLYEEGGGLLGRSPEGESGDHLKISRLPFPIFSMFRCGGTQSKFILSAEQTGIPTLSQTAVWAVQRRP